MNNEKIISGIRQKDTNTINWIYQNYFLPIENLITSNSGTRQDAQDVFQDVMLIIYRQIQNKDLILTCSFQTYLHSISKNIWFEDLRRKRKKLKNIFHISSETQDFHPILDDVSQMINTIYNKSFDELSDRCRKILILHFLGEKSKEIMQSLNISSSKVLKTKIYKCKKSLIESIIKSKDYEKIKDERY